MRARMCRKVSSQSSYDKPDGDTGQTQTLVAAALVKVVEQQTMLKKTRRKQAAAESYLCVEIKDVYGRKRKARQRR